MTDKSIAEPFSLTFQTPLNIVPLKEVTLAASGSALKARGIKTEKVH